jgi:hypothetical protein
MPSFAYVESVLRAWVWSTDRFHLSTGLSAASRNGWISLRRGFVVENLRCYSGRERR